MTATDFPAWYSAGVFGGIGCALLSAIAIATWSLWRGRGVTRQAVGALLVCVVASALDIGPLLWIEYRLSVYGPTLSAMEVVSALSVAALVGWVAPLGAILWYSLLATPATLAPVRSGRLGVVAPAALDDSARMRAVSDGGRPWGLLTPVTNTLGVTGGRPIELAHELTIIGREQDNDVVLDDERVSRRHAELRWERGRVELADYGSLNGTRVNQQAVRGRTPLRDGDVIELGSHRYHLVLQPNAIMAQITTDDASEQLQTRKTASASGAFSLGAPRLQMTLIQGACVSSGTAPSWPLAAPVTTIGRDPSCGIILSDTSISRIHAQITRQPAGHFIADLQSSNGVTLNGERLTAPAQIFAGDVVALGECVLRCEEVSAATRTTVGPTTSAAASEPAAQPQAAPVAQPTQTPSFHMRIAPEWAARRTSHPRLAPPRLTPAPRSNPSRPRDAQG